MVVVTRRLTQVSMKGKRLRRGERMIKGKGWRLARVKGKVFVGSLLETVDVGSERLAIFRINKSK
jgi:hypothetical protein